MPSLIISNSAKQQAVQNIIDNLQISTLEYRNESDPDVLPYVHDRKIEHIKVYVCVCVFVSVFCYPLKSIIQHVKANFLSNAKWL